MRRIITAAAIPLALSLAACGDDDAPTDVDTSDVTADAGDDTGADIVETDGSDDTTSDVGDDGGVEDVDPEDVQDDTSVDAEEDVDTSNPPTAPINCIGEATTVTLTPGTPISAELEAENTTTTNVMFDFQGNEITEATDVEVGCAADIVPDGVTAVSPAFTVTSAGVQRFARRYVVHTPFFPGAMPAEAGPSMLRVYYRAPGGETFEPIVLNFQEDVGNGIARFHTELVGTFQIGIEDDAGTPEERLWNFRAVAGVSMGGLGSSMLGARHPDRFDIVAPLGGPAEWVYLSHYIRDGGMGGFDHHPDASPTVPYTPNQELEHGMSYDNWYFPTGEGTGGSFNRDDYSEIFIDLMMAAGNIISYNPDSPFRAGGLPLEETLRPASQRCLQGNTCPPDPDATFTIPSGYYDDEYNPSGSLPVIAFCDGRGDRNSDIPFDRACDVNFDDEPDETNEGLYTEPCAQFRPVDITMAVDVNGNGMRDPGEPVIRNFYEPFEDVGADGIASVDEEGYDPIANPDPAGDDYDFVNNPFGTENNWLYEEGEPYEDTGIDGVEDTLASPYDFGEGNGVFDYNPNLQRVFNELSPRHLLAQMSPEELRDTNWYIDAGVRDLFNFSVGANQLAGTMQGLGMNVRVYDEFYRFQGLDDGLGDRFYNFIDVDYGEVGENVYVRYGNVDADEEDVCFGDGKHVGTVSQIANRIVTMLGFITNRFPDGDRTQVRAPFALATGTYLAPLPNGARYRYSIAFPPGHEITQCSDGRDNDRDGLKDGDDPDCTSAAVMSEGGEDLNYCNDGVDNDKDGRSDEDDPDCVAGDGSTEWPAGSVQATGTYPVVYIMHGYGMAPEDLQITALPFSSFMAQGEWPKVITVFPDGYCGEVEVTQCNDGVDNDDDGVIDAEDEGCAESGGRAENGIRVSYCLDGIDNDRDGYIDGGDGGCLSEEWDNEADCQQGNFYTDHVAYPDGIPGGPQYEQLMLDLMDHIDSEYRARPPEAFPYAR